MTVALGDHPLPWTEREYLALGETAERIELFDGGLLIGPVPALRHQSISGALCVALLPAADAAGLDTLAAVNVRLGRDRIAIPDLVAAREAEPDGFVLDASQLLLVGEIVAPTSEAIDRVLKMHYYAEAGIEWYLLVDPDGPTMQLYHHEGGRYVQHAAGARGMPLAFPGPINVTIDPATLVRAGR